MLRSDTKKRENRLRRKKRVRMKITGGKERPRLSVYRSSKHIYAQIIDDTEGRTLASACSLMKDLGEVSSEEGEKHAISKAVGKLLAKRALEKGVTQVCFDRGSYLYHGRVRALAEAAREGGLEF